MKNYIQDIGNQRFSDINSQTSAGQTKSKDKASSPQYPFSYINLHDSVAMNVMLDYFDYLFGRVLIRFHSIVKGFTPNLQLQHILLGKKYAIYVSLLFF